MAAWGRRALPPLEGDVTTVKNSREITRRLKALHGVHWRQRYVPQSPPRTPLGALWRAIIEQCGYWPGASGLGNKANGVWEDIMPGMWVEDTATFMLLLGRYPPAFVADGTYSSGKDPTIRKQANRVKGCLMLNVRLGPRGGWAGLLFGTAELLCPPAAWPPRLHAALLEATRTMWVPTPRRMAHQLLANDKVAALPSVETADAPPAEDMAAFLLFCLGITFEQMERAHAIIQPGLPYAQQPARAFEDAALRAIERLSGSPAFIIWASGMDAEQLEHLTPSDQDYLNMGIRPDWDTKQKNQAFFAYQKHTKDLTALRRPPDTLDPFDNYTWPSVQAAIADRSSHIAYAYQLWDRFKSPVVRELDLAAAPKDPLTTPIPVISRLKEEKARPYPHSRPETAALIVAQAKRQPLQGRPKGRQLR
jgi:hypothetical protein